MIETISNLINELYSMSKNPKGIWNSLMYLSIIIGVIYYTIIVIRNLFLSNKILNKIRYDLYGKKYKLKNFRQPSIKHFFYKFQRILNFSNHQLGSTINQIKVSIIGYLIIFIGVVFLNLNIKLFDLIGIFLLVIGFQVLLWSININSELFGNKVYLTDYKRKRKRKYF